MNKLLYECAEVGILRESGNWFTRTELDTICIRLKFPGNLQLLCYGLLENKEWEVFCFESIECVIDNTDMWMFKFEHLKKNLADYMYKDIVSSKTNVEVLNANFDVEHSYEIIGLFEWYWGGWNSTPDADVMQIVAKKWYEKYDAELIRISHDTLSFECRKLSENEAQILMREIKT